MSDLCKQFLLIHFCVLVFLCLLSTGCTNNKEQIITTAPANQSNSSMDRPLNKKAEINIEGHKEILDLQLYGEKENLPFSTYIPKDDISTKHISSNGKNEINFYANFNNQLNENAYLKFFIPKPENKISLEELKENLLNKETLLKEKKLSLTGKIEDDSICKWAKEVYTFTTENESGISTANSVNGLICLGEHNSRPFYTIAHFPSEYAESFIPRMKLIFSEFRWSDDKTGLS